MLDNKISRPEFLKLMGAGSLFFGLGALGISNIFKNIREASATKEAAALPSNNTTHNDMNKINSLDIRHFQVNVPEAELTELRRRINATRWPEKETVTDASQGVQLATIQKLARY